MVANLPRQSLEYATAGARHHSTSPAAAAATRRAAVSHSERLASGALAPLNNSTPLANAHLASKERLKGHAQVAVSPAPASRELSPSRSGSQFGAPPHSDKNKAISASGQTAASKYMVAADQATPSVRSSRSEHATFDISDETSIR